MGDDLQRLLEERAKIDRALSEKHREVRTVLFTDIVGSTALFERKGDIEGLAFVQRHNALLFPIVEAEGGWIVKTIGDAILAVFERPEAGLRAAARMQAALQEDRRERPDLDPIHVRIGVHTGPVMISEDDVFGDTVNTAARIEGQAEADEVLLSAAVREALPEAIEGFEVVTEPCGAIPLKGKVEVVPVLALRWGEGAPPARRLAATPRASAATPQVTGSGRALPPILVLDLMESGGVLKASVMDGEQDKGPLRTFAESSFDRRAADALLGRFDTYLGGSAGSYASRLRDLGERLWRTALPRSVAARLETTERAYLRLQVDERFADIPWELLHDGRAFLGMRFAVGRVVETSAHHLPPRSERGHGRVALVVSDPEGDLEAAREEGAAIAGLLQEGFGGEVRHLEGPLTRADLLGALEGVGLIHFAGHVRRRGETVGLSLADGVLVAAEIVDACAAGPPSLIFANACHAGGRGEWRDDVGRSLGLASAFLLAGVRHYLGPSGVVPDAEALRFSLRFWEMLLSGERYGEAVRLSKVRLVETDPAGLAFARYHLYGEPRSSLPPDLALRKAEATRAGAPAATLTPGFAPPSRPWYRQRWLLAALGAVLIATLQFWVRHAWSLYQAEQATQAGAPPTAGAGARRAGAIPPTAGPATPDGPPKEGPIAVSVLTFKGMGLGEPLAYLEDGLSETVITDFGESPEVRLIERAQIDLDIGEIDFSQSKYVDPSTRAKLGKIVGAEVVVLGSVQKAGDRLRAIARFVHVETGEVLLTTKVEGSASDVFELQDRLAAEVRGAVPRLVERLR